jgi:hypothetical protein
MQLSRRASEIAVIGDRDEVAGDFVPHLGHSFEHHMRCRIGITWKVVKLVHALTRPGQWCSC